MDVGLAGGKWPALGLGSIYYQQIRILNSSLSAWKSEGALCFHSLDPVGAGCVCTCQTLKEDCGELFIT